MIPTFQNSRVPAGCAVSVAFESRHKSQPFQKYLSIVSTMTSNELVTESSKDCKPTKRQKVERLVRSCRRCWLGVFLIFLAFRVGFSFRQFLGTSTNFILDDSTFFVTESRGLRTGASASISNDPIDSSSSTDQQDHDYNVTSVDSVCRRAIHHWTSNHLSQSPVTALWNHDYVQRQLQKATYQAILDCFTCRGGVRNVTEDTVLHNFIEPLHSMLDIYRLKKTLKTRAHPFVMERVVEVILRRLADPVHNPPLKIAVFGGSVTEGTGATVNNLGLSDSGRFCIAGCPWAHKLQVVLNHLLQEFSIPPLSKDAQNKVFPVVQIQNYGVGGTDSSMGSTLLEFNLFGDDMAKYDVFIQSYSSNDHQAPSGVDRDEIKYHDMQKFMRLAKAQRPCSDLPLVIQLEDTLLDSLPLQKKTIYGGLQYAREMVETAGWADFMSISYSDATRHFAYRNAADKTPDTSQFGILHPGQLFHTGIAWVLAYNFLEGLLDACDASSIVPQHDQNEPRTGTPLPLLTKDLAISDENVAVNTLWKQQSDDQERLCSLSNRNGTSTSCVYKWVTHRLGAATSAMVHAAVAKVATNIEGWQSFGYPVRKPRRTWKANTANATFTIQVNNTQTPVNRLLVLYLKSYGKSWEAARLQIVVEGRKSNSTDVDAFSWKEVDRSFLDGAHNVATSISYSHHANLGDTLLAGSDVRITFTLVGGDTFQINGIALCHMMSNNNDLSWKSK